MQEQLFEQNEIKGAEFSNCRKYRYVLWRIWDQEKPKLMFIGLNPSTANEATDDRTIQKVRKIAKNLGYGGVYMTNCFAYISTDPKLLISDEDKARNYRWLNSTADICKAVVFAWGGFKIVNTLGRGKELKEMFPGAFALHVNANGSPKHPLFCLDKQQLIKYENN